MEAKYETVRLSDPIAYVLSLNLHRRHLDTSQRAMVAARARKLFDDRAKERMQAGVGPDGSGGRGNKRNPPAELPEGLVSGRDARDDAAALVNVGGRTVDYATRVIKKGVPELVKAVDAGQITVTRAATIASKHQASRGPSLGSVDFLSRPFLAAPKKSSKILP